MLYSNGRYCISAIQRIVQQIQRIVQQKQKLDSKNKNWIANAIIVLIPPKKCKKNKKCIGKMAEKPSLFAEQLFKQKYNY